ncbi:MAG: division/cell wall cluster transcriptional repressor MraZ [Casimicrobiaceae bacterium]|nr:division/cell wall cluster transcriptional repressor MraZ [Casimicrobiaceae bacterium]MCX8098804.1 division/cell wall cluster transcriptional repressor MraZ [Casimicrobiaceae bacterium]MDW8311543.1 division/cell wall cluster transcriptional repressor MraZ [Burkholderiales bacterium]
MFTGPSSLSLDSKGRIAIPTRYREPLGRHVVLTADPSGCVLLFTPERWATFAERVAALPNMNPKIRALQRVWLGCQCDAEIDSAGRLLIPADLREHAGFGDLVKMRGMFDRFELWSAEGWANVVRMAREASEAIPEELLRTSL